MASTHEDLTRKFEVEGSSDRTLGLVFAGFFTLVTFWPMVRHHAPRLWAAPVAILFFVVALTMPRLLGPLNRAWTQLGLLIQRIMHPLVMGIMFYLIFTPAGWLLRLLGNDLLHLKYEPESNTYWISKPPADLGGMARQF